MNSKIAKKRINEVVRPDTMTTSRADFLATHVPVDSIELYSKFDPNDSSKTVKYQEAKSEEDVFKQFILNPEDNHQFLLVVGESGAGKSHLIRWFNERLLNEALEDEVVLFVSRSDNTLKGTIKQLLNKPEIENISNKEVYKRLVDATSVVDENKLKGEILAKFILEVEHDEEDGEEDVNEENAYVSPNERRKLVAFLKYKKVQNRMLEIDGPIDRIYLKVAQSGRVATDVNASFLGSDFDFEDEDWEEIFDNADKDTIKMARKISLDPLKKNNIASYLNKFVDTVVQRCSGLESGDFEEIFKDIRRKLKADNKRLTILIEDITSFTGVNAALLNALTGWEHTKKGNEDLCRISSVVGITSGYYKDVFKTNHRDRVSLFINLPNDVYSDNYLYEYVARYLNAMSLEEDELIHWINDGAVSDKYPIHNVTEGKDWEYFEMTSGKKLSLYPFTKIAIKNLYTNRLASSQLRTPRYILQYIIEPVVKDALYHKKVFPNLDLKSYNKEDAFGLRTRIFNLSDVSDETKERLFLFSCVWGNAKDTCIIRDDGVKLIAGIPISIYEELELPILTDLNTVVIGNSKESGGIEKNNKDKKIVNLPKTSRKVITNDLNIQKINSAIDALNKWVNGGTINVGATTDNVILISNARDDIKNYLMGAINWQSEGVSQDNFSKILSSKYKNFIGFENQTSGLDRVLYVLKASRKNQEVIEAFIKWSVLGDKSWNFENGEYFALAVESWTELNKPDIIKAVKDVNDRETNYYEYAFASEIYRQILFGQIQTDWKSYSSCDMLSNQLCEKDSESGHSSDWNKLLDTILNTDKHKYNRETVLQFFNLTQGSRGGSKVYLDRKRFDVIFDTIKSQNLNLDYSDTFKDFVTTRDEFRLQFEKISTKLDKAYQSELTKIQDEKANLEKVLGTSQLTSDEILTLINSIKGFYDEVNSALLFANYDGELINNVKSNRNEISEALDDICRIVKGKDRFENLILMAKDPIKTLKDFKKLCQKILDDMNRVTNQIRKQSGDFIEKEEPKAGKSYKEQQKMIKECKKIIERLGDENDD